MPLAAKLFRPAARWVHLWPVRLTAMLATSSRALLDQGTLELKHQHPYSTSANLQPDSKQNLDLNFSRVLGDLFPDVSVPPSGKISVVDTHVKLSAGEREQSLFRQTQSLSPKRDRRRLAYVGMITMNQRMYALAFPSALAGLYRQFSSTRQESNIKLKPFSRVNLSIKAENLK